MRKGIMGMPVSTARSISRLIWGEVLEWAENTRTMVPDPSMPSTMASPQSVPGRISRGAIQQRMPLASREATMASAVGLSWLE